MPILNIVKLDSFKAGDISVDGSMPDTGTLSALYGMSEGTANINIGEPQSTPKYVEESNVPFANLEGTRDADVSIEVVGAEAQAIAGLIGGNYVAANATDPETISFASNSSAVFKALELKGENSDGDQVTVRVPKAQMLSSWTGVIGRGNLRGWTIKGKISTPVDGAGKAQDWLFITLGDPAA